MIQPTKARLLNRITIAIFDTMPDAHIAMGRLRAAGIESWLLDEHLVQTDWLYSIAVGGIKLTVDGADAEIARQELDTDYSDSETDQK